MTSRYRHGYVRGCTHAAALWIADDQDLTGRELDELVDALEDTFLIHSRELLRHAGSDRLWQQLVAEHITQLALFA